VDLPRKREKPIGARSVRCALRAAAALVLTAAALTVFPSAANAASVREGAGLVPMGDAVGLSISCEGVMVTATRNENGESISPARASGIEPGDVIIRVGDATVRSGEDLRAALDSLSGAPIDVRVKRGGRELTYTVTPRREPDGSYRLGLVVRDMLTGIGTLTFYDPESGVFGALGHSAGDSDTGVILPLRDGVIANTSIVGVVRGQAASPGQLRGSFDASGTIGHLRANTERGIFGVLNDAEAAHGRQAVPVGATEEIETGSASILCTVAGNDVREYAVEITRVYSGAGNAERGMMLSVSDPELIELTGGIVQGMSGSPILQNGKLIGAVTHVLVGDPTKGYGISIESMLAASEAAEEPPAMRGAA
jgi:stage IV sporulation protein B